MRRPQSIERMHTRCFNNFSRINIPSLYLRASASSSFQCVLTSTGTGLFTFDVATERSDRGLCCRALRPSHVFQRVCTRRIQFTLSQVLCSTRPCSFCCAVVAVPLSNHRHNVPRHIAHPAACAVMARHAGKEHVIVHLWQILQCNARPYCCAYDIGWLV
jgi:hypothetical protein